MCCSEIVFFVACRVPGSQPSGSRVLPVVFPPVTEVVATLRSLCRLRTFFDLWVSQKVHIGIHQSLYMFWTGAVCFWLSTLWLDAMLWMSWHVYHISPRFLVLAAFLGRDLRRPYRT
eukprot:TRINITY_DN10321_c0_g3_i1.p3 TRINITY_DN10321_c0_g3~~TRINITY_DN10321_c0_g3_i1.p3  ORF type:complete len:117 (-),score=4.26 TRINITY_DN10321_c0_g3_i1:198-548(-)